MRLDIFMVQVERGFHSAKNGMSDFDFRRIGVQSERIVNEPREK
jgi:hypothetical protein